MKIDLQMFERTYPIVENLRHGAANGVTMSELAALFGCTNMHEQRDQDTSTQ